MESSGNMIPGSIFINKLNKRFKDEITKKTFCKHKDITLC